MDPKDPIVKSCFWLTTALSALLPCVENVVLRRYLQSLPDPTVLLADEEDGLLGAGSGYLQVCK